MLAVTEQAATVIRAIADRPELPEGAGLRIASDTGAPEDLSVAAATNPEDGDQVVDEKGARIFVDSSVVARLDDKVLDARVDDGGSAEFLVSRASGRTRLARSTSCTTIPSGSEKNVIHMSGTFVPGSSIRLGSLLGVQPASTRRVVDARVSSTPSAKR